MFVCPACQTENRPTAKFCRKCGLRRQVTDGSAVAVATPVERPAGPEQTSSTANAEARGTDDGKRAATAAVATSAADPEGQTDELGELEDEFGEEITEEEVQKELEQKRPGSAESQQGEAGQHVPSSGTDPSQAQESETPQADQAPADGQPVEPRRGGHTCPSCGSNVRVTDKFCIWCGERQPQRTVPKMKRCSECRTQLPMTANYCFVCGNDVSLHLRRKVRVPSELFHEEDPELFPTYEA